MKEIKLEFISEGVERVFLRSRFREIDMQFGEKVLQSIAEEIIKEKECLVI